MIQKTKSLNRFLFPCPYSWYTEQTFGNNLKWAKVKTREVPYVVLQNQIKKECNVYMIYFHGNGEDIESSKYFYDQLMPNLQVNFVLVEYPGYGVYKKEKTSAELIEEDALAIYDHIKIEFGIQDQQIYVFGRSIGTGPAFYIASLRKCKGLIAMSAFKSIKHFIMDMNYYDKYKEELNTDMFNNFDKSKKVNSPILLIHGQDDTLITVNHSEEIYKDLPPEIQQISKFVARPEMTHNQFDFLHDLAEPILTIIQIDLLKKKVYQIKIEKYFLILYLYLMIKILAEYQFKQYLS